ncbi:MAG TPA: FtsW/RodA/SpoVE family cell cycle protein, partial [Myxococcota bacterium]|nr:FtsW/RodA/SpoVE family cell cycle protein [Myxococcota bacterium]
MRARPTLLLPNDSDVGTLISAVGILAGIGAIAVFSATTTLSDATLSPHFVRHAAGLAVGAALLVGASLLPLVAWRRLAYPLYAASLVALIATLALGFVAGGARRWLMLPGGGVFQPVELAKLATVLAVAALLGRRDGRTAGVGRQRL